jgi:opacity protein-like surface antigen
MAIPLTPRSLGPAPPKTKPPEKAATPQASNGLEARQFSMTLLGLVAPTKIDVDKSMSFEQNVEMGSLAASHPYETGFGGEVGIRYLFRENMGIQASLSFLSRDGSADFTARLPHPFFFDQHREVEGHVDTVSYHEIAVPVDFVYQRSVVKITYAVFAGASFFNVKADVVGVPQYVESYPFDIVTVTNVPVVNSSKSAVGFNVGGDVSYWVSDRLDVGVRLRFSRAKADLGTVGSTVEVNAGGFVAGAGLSVRF